MLQNQPIVTIITATYNLISQGRTETFLQCVNSVKSQSYANIEHIIIDGGSTDGTIDLIKSTGLRYISEQDKGIYDAFNKGIKIATGKYVNFLNSDDFFNNNDAIKKSVELLEKTNADFSYATATLLKDNDKFFKYFKPNISTVYSRMPFCHQTMFTKVDILKKEGYFNLTYKSASDYDFIIKCFLNGYKYCELKDNIASFRLTGESCLNQRTSILEQLAIFKDLYKNYANLSEKEYESIIIMNIIPIKLLFKLPNVNFKSYISYLLKNRKKLIRFRSSMNHHSYLYIMGKCLYGSIDCPNTMSMNRFLQQISTKKPLCKLGITGGSGVIGQILCKKLEEKNISYSIFKGDIRDKKDIKKWIKNNDWDGIIHLAAIVPTKQVDEKPLEAYAVNTLGTLNLLLELQREWKEENKWFFYASTSHVYESSDKPVAETAKLSPISLYGKTKLMAEEIVRDADKIKNFPINVCIGRIFSFYHKTQKPPFLYPSIIERLQKEDLKKEFFVYGADSVRDFLNAEEVVDIIISLAQKQSIGIFNIASGIPTKIRDFVQSQTKIPLNIKTDGKTNYLVADTAKLKKELEKDNVK